MSDSGRKANSNDKISPLKPKVQNWHISTFDLETRPKGSEDSLIAPFCMGATYHKGEVSLWYNLASMLGYMLSHGKQCRWYAHNGAGFDFKHFLTDLNCLALLREGNWQISVIGGASAKGLLFQSGKRKISFCDSAKLMPSSLASLSKAFGTAVPKGHIDFDGGEIFDFYNQDHVDYLIADVICLHEVLTQYRKTINVTYGQEPRFTASSTAFACFRAGLQRPIYRHPETLNQWIHGVDSEGQKIPETGCYYGGRTEAFYQGAVNNVTYIDVNSLYAHIMSEFGGIERPFYTSTHERGLPGFYRVNVCGFGDKFGLLPYRLPSGGLGFPVGSFETCCSSLEIELAREHGWQVDVVEGWAFEEWNKGLFRPFIERCKELRQRDYGGGLGMTAKFLQNNLYGFFGMKPHRPETLFSEHDPGDGYEPSVDPATGRLSFAIWQRATKQDTINCIPAFAAWITSAARVYLTRAMLAEEAAGNTVLYCDTDSIFLSVNHPSGTPVSPIADGEYGAFKVEYTFDELMVITGKMYAGMRLDKDRVIDYFKAKGLPQNLLSRDLYTRALHDNVATVFEYPQLFSLIQSAKRLKLGQTAKRSCAVPASIGNRIQGENGWTRPLTLSG